MNTGSAYIFHLNRERLQISSVEAGAHPGELRSKGGVGGAGVGSERIQSLVVGRFGDWRQDSLMTECALIPKTLQDSDEPPPTRGLATLEMEK